MVTFRNYQNGDEVQITSLFARVFGRPMSTDYWRWRFLEHPTPTSVPLVMLAFDGDAIVANYAASQAPLTIGGDAHPACLSMMTMTHPDWRGKRLFERAAEALYQTLPDRGIRSIYGFPNTAVHALRLLKVGWSDYYEVPTLSLDVKNLAAIPSMDPVVEVVLCIDERFTRFNKSIASDLPIAGQRNADILSWRVDRNPKNTYTRFVVREGAEISGYAVTKPYGDDMLDLVELRASGRASARALIKTVIAHAAADQRSKIATWCLPSESHRIPLEIAGFNAGGPVTYFGGRVFGSLPADLTDPRLWRLSMLDSDLY